MFHKYAFIFYGDIFMEPRVRFELTTFALQMRRSTAELTRQQQKGKQRS